jgi:DNA helicase II / ATP-dependent DNA helicase PcrA
VVVTTMHKAKGLEWDKVYLLSVNNFDFPSAQPGDHFMSEKFYIRDKLNLEAEIVAKIKALVDSDIPGLYLAYGAATEEARLNLSSERLRLLYVGITRAKKELVITWNTGHMDDCTPALPLVALSSHLEEQAHARAGNLSIQPE